MKSRISFSKLTAFKKDITRFAPLWAVYLIGGFLVMMTLTDSRSAGSIASNLASTIGPFSIINMIYAALVAQLLFGDLYNSRLCNALHAMPLRREQWFLSHVGAGLCFSVVPHLLVMPMVMLAMGEFWFVGLFWLLGMGLEYLFFFGLAVLSCLCVGNRFAMVAVYAILNFGSMIAYWFCATIYEPMMYGVVLSPNGFIDLCPVVRMTAQAEMVIMEGKRVEQGYLSYVNIWTYEGLGEGWGYLVLCAVIGLALLGAALLLYRRRRLESAGDFIAAKPLAPVFSVVFTLCVSAVCAMFGSLFSDGYMVMFLIAGLIVGYFAGQMLLARTAKVFRLKAFLKLGLIAAAMILSLFLVQWDAFGIVRWVPEADQVKVVTLASRQVELTDPEDIQLVIDLHEEAIQLGEDHHTTRDYTYVRIQYELKNGNYVERRYEIPTHSSAYQALKVIYGRTSLVLGDVSDMDAYVARLTSVQIHGQEIKMDPEGIRGLVEAIKTDCEAGRMAQQTSYHDSNSLKTYIYLETIDEQNIYSFREIMVFADATATIAWLEEHVDDWVISPYLK